MEASLEASIQRPAEHGGRTLGRAALAGDTGAWAEHTVGLRIDHLVDPLTLLVAALDEIDYGMMLLDESGRVRVANEAARRHCRAGGALAIDAGVLQLRDAEAARVWPKALWQARQGARSLISMADGGERRMLAVVPLRAGGGAAVLLVIGRPHLCEPLSLDFFARAHRLTHTETEVLRSLGEGVAPADIARQSGVALSTVRTQIGSLRAKTGAASIRALIGLVAALPPMVPALRTGGGGGNGTGTRDTQHWRAAA